MYLYSFLTFGTRQTSVVSFIDQPKSTRQQQDTKLDGTQDLSQHGGEEKIYFPMGIKPHPAHTLVIILTELHQLLYLRYCLKNCNLISVRIFKVILTPDSGGMGRKHSHSSLLNSLVCITLAYNKRKLTPI